MYYSEQIEAYLRNELSAEEKVIFEEMIRRDPLLENELELQHDIVQIIQEYRIKQLKARLNQIPTDFAYTPSNGYKAAGIALASLLIVGSLGYFAYDRFKPETELPKQVLNDKSQQTDMPDSVFGNIPETDSVQTITEAKDVRSSDNGFEPKKQADTKQAITPKPNLTEPEETQPSEESLNKKQENSQVPTGDLTPIPKNTKGVQVSVDSKNPQYKFHYNFSEGKLVLYGNFEQLYEILDFSSKDSKQIYLYYQEDFYRLNENQTITAPLQKVNNPQLIKTLREARSKGQ